MSDKGRPRRAVDESVDVAALEPYLALAREIQAEVARVAAEGPPDVDSLVDALDRIPLVERAAVARAVFERLPDDVQWGILERVFDDDELREVLSSARQERLDAAGRSRAIDQVLSTARSTGELATDTIPSTFLLTLGLVREADAPVAVRRGRQSSSCARRLVLRSRGDGSFRVVEDVFNPDGTYFVTADYDASTWADERLHGHTTVRVGALTDGPGDRSLEPVLFPGGRVDLTTESDRIRGRLHLGFVILGDNDVFADR